MKRRYLPVFLTVLAATLALASCGPSGESNTASNPVGEEAAVAGAAVAPTETLEAATPEAATPEATQAPAEPTMVFRLNTAPTVTTTVATRTPVATPTATPTPVPAGPAVRPSAQALGEKLAAFRAALKAQARPERAAQLQLELLAEAQTAEAAVQGDRSAQAAEVREAITAIRGGAGGNNQQLEQAAGSLRSVLGGDRNAPAPAGAAPRLAGGLNLAEPAELAHKLQERIAGYQQAQRERNTENLLRRQADLVQMLGDVEAALVGDDSTEATRLRTATADVSKGLRGDAEALTRGLATVQSLTGAGAPDAAAADVTALAQALGAKLATLREAIAANDRPALLRQQRELLDELNRAERALRDGQGREAEQLRVALNALRDGVSGDQAKLDRATDQLRQIGGGGAIVPQRSTGASQADPQKAARTLQERVRAMQRALNRGNPDDLLRAQRELIEAVEQVDSGLHDAPGADEVRAAVEAIRNGLAGDLGKFDEAAQRLGAPPGERSQSSAAPAPASKPVDVKPLADQVAGKLAAIAEAQKRNDAVALARARTEAEAAFDRIASGLPNGGGPDLQRLRTLLDQARGAMAGDQAKQEAAQRTIEEIRH